MSVDAIRELERSLLTGSRSRLPRGIVDLRPASEAEEREFMEVLRQLLTRTTALRAFDGKGEFQFGDVDALYFEALDGGSPGYVVEALNYLRLYQALAAQLRPLLGGSPVWFGDPLSAHGAQLLLRSIEARPAFDRTLLSSALALGKVHALSSREDASRVFSESRRSLEGLIPVFMGDRGAATYFGRASLRDNRELIRERRKSFGGLEWHGPACGRDTRFVVLMSCEQKFFRIYFPYWLSVAEYLKRPGFSFHILITGPAETTSQLIDDAESLRCALGRFRGQSASGYARNVSFSTVEMPTWCTDHRTFAACARFLFVREVVERVERPIVVQDMDSHLVTDPAPWFEALPGDRIALRSTPVRMSIDPWQKFRGHGFVLPPMDSAAALARRLEDYLLLGLGELYSWFLDQNALGFLYETAVWEEHEEGGETLVFSLHGLLSGLQMPSAGADVHELFERSQGLRQVSRVGGRA